MYLIPFFKKEELTISGNRLLKIVLFLSNGGTSFLSDISTLEIKSFCQENGFSVKKQFSTSNGNFLEVDPSKMDLSSYYTYSEAFKTQNECWRTIVLVFSDTNQDIWNVNTLFQDTPFLKPLLDIVHHQEVV